MKKTETTQATTQETTQETMTREEKNQLKKIERKERNARIFSWLYLGVAIIALLLVVFWGRGKLGFQQNNAAEFNLQQKSVTPEVLGDVETRTDRELDYFVVQAEKLYAALTAENATETNDALLEVMTELDKLEDVDVQRAAYGYVSMMHAVAQNVINQQYDVSYADDEADCRELVEANQALYYEYNGF